MKNKNAESGNIIFFILIAVVLMAYLAFAIMRGDGGSRNNINKEQLIIYATEVEQYGSELAQAVKIVLDTGISEADISFAHDNAPSEYGTTTGSPPSTQIFSSYGGQAEYRLPKSDISTASNWEFYGELQMPQVGSSRADLIAVLPNVTREFCDVFNTRQGLDITSTYPADSVECIYSGIAGNRYDGDFNATPNNLDLTTFSAMPALRACVACIGSSPAYHVYSVIYER
ncbi:MAG: hypothetical protein ACPG05_02195 [Bdellovibrionales bacterium]